MRREGKQHFRGREGPHLRGQSLVLQWEPGWGQVGTVLLRTVLRGWLSPRDCRPSPGAAGWFELRDSLRGSLSANITQLSLTHSVLQTGDFLLLPCGPEQVPAPSAAFSLSAQPVSAVDCSSGSGGALTRPSVCHGVRF